MFKLLFLISLFLSTSFCYSQIVINEYSCSNINTLTDSNGEFEDWVELYNTSGSTVNLSGYYLSDKSTNLTKWQIPSGSINSNGFLTFFCSGRNLVNGSELHPNFTLTQTTGEWIILTKPDGITVEDSLKIIHYTKSGHSVGRATNAASIWKLFTTPTPSASNTGAINFYTPKPVMSVAPGFYNSSQTVSITCSDPTATIRYTLDGSNVLVSSPIYTGPITIASTKVLRATAFSTNEPSFTETNTYFINVNHTIPVVSVCSNDLNYMLTTGSLNLTDIIGAFELFEEDKSFIDEGEGNFNHHGNDSWAYNQRGFDFIMRDQFGYNNEIKHQIFPEKSRNKFQRIILKAAANDNYPFETGGAYIRDAFTHTLSNRAGLKLDARTWKPCILYLNGQYWGVYEIREKIDDADYTDYYFNQNKFNLQYLKTWGATLEEYGAPNAIPDWDALKAYIQANNMGVTANFNYVDSQLSIESLVDYFVFNSFLVTQDWLNWNTAWWRGMDPNGQKKKWRYTLWDLDATFGHYTNYTNIPNNTPTADPCNVENLPDPGGQGHTEIISKLIDENPTVKQYYITRYADLMNTYLNCNYLIPLLDSMINEIQPEMQGQINRWGGTYTEWQANVQAMKDYITARCTAIEQGMVNCYNLSGPYDVIFDVSPANSGTIKVNSINVPTYPWTSQYYGGIQTLMKAKANPGYVFDHWGYTSGPLTNGDFEDTNSINITQNQTITAFFVIDDGDLDDDGLTDDEETTGIDDPLTTSVPNGTSDPSDNCDPYITGPTCDPDNDGITNENEIIAGTNANNPDSDNDGLTDGEEINNVDDPTTVLIPSSTSNAIDHCDPIKTTPECIETHGVNMPSGFSPNNDGKNDLLKLIIGTDVKYFTISIYDRWGNKMIQSSDPKFTWDGTNNGKNCSSGAYPFVIDIQYNNGSSEQKTGNVTLIK